MVLNPYPVDTHAYTVSNHALQTDVGATKSLMDAVEDGDLAEWDRVDAPWSASNTAAHVYEGSWGLYGSPSTGTDVVIALAGSLQADFAPGEVYHFPHKSTSTDTVECFFAKQDTTLGTNWYRLQIRNAGGTGGFDVSKDVSGTETEFFDYGSFAQFPGQGAWAHTYLMWDTDAIAGDPHDADGNQTGDFYVEIQDDNHVPRASFYVDASDTEYRGGGVGFSIGGSQEYAFDLLEKGSSPDAFADFNPGGHFTGQGEIHFFRTGDLTSISTATNSSVPNNLQMVGSAEVPAARNNYCLKYLEGAGFSDAQHSAPAQGLTDLPNYLPDGQRGRVFVRTPTIADEAYVGCASDGGGGDYLRAELDYANSRFRLLEIVAGGVTVVANNTGLSWLANTWYEVEFDRTTSGDVTATVTEDGGAQLTSATHTLDTSLVGNDGILVAGGANGGDGPPFYFDHWENLSV